MQSQPEWTRFRVGPLSTEPNWTNDDCQQLDMVSHVAHLETALRIVNDGKIVSGLVFDKSRLNKERILVVWLSPNDWTGAGGYRYGNVRFRFEWERLIQDKRFYWVESIAYGIPACRILVTTQDYGSKLQEYDPTLRDGPWWYDVADNKHYWNGKYCLEVMLEEDVLIHESAGVDFVGHHPKRCSVDWRTCPDRGLRSDRASALFLAAVIARNIEPSALKFAELKSGKITPTWTLQKAWHKLVGELPRVQEANSKGQLVDWIPTSLPVARAILSAYAQCRQEDILHLASLFRSEMFMIRTCARLIGAHFQLDDLTSLVPGLVEVYEL